MLKWVKALSEPLCFSNVLQIKLTFWFEQWLQVLVTLLIKSAMTHQSIIISFASHLKLLAKHRIAWAHRHATHIQPAVWKYCKISKRFRGWAVSRSAVFKMFSLMMPWQKTFFFLPWSGLCIMDCHETIIACLWTNQLVEAEGNYSLCILLAAC